MGLRPIEIFLIFQRWDHLYTSESDVYRRQILTYKEGPGAERVKLGIIQHRDIYTWLNSGIRLYCRVFTCDVCCSRSRLPWMFRLQEPTDCMGK